MTSPPNDTLISSLTGHGINVAAIAVGFLATSLSILVSIERARVIQVLREAEYYPIVLGYLVAPIRLWFGVALLSAVLLLAWDRVPLVYHRLDSPDGSSWCHGQPQRPIESRRSWPGSSSDRCEPGQAGAPDV